MVEHESRLVVHDEIPETFEPGNDRSATERHRFQGCQAERFPFFRYGWIHENRRLTVLADEFITADEIDPFHAVTKRRTQSVEFCLITRPTPAPSRVHGADQPQAPVFGQNRVIF